MTSQDHTLRIWQIQGLTPDKKTDGQAWTPRETQEWKPDSQKKVEMRESRGRGTFFKGRKLLDKKGR